MQDRSTILGQAIDAYLQGRTQQEDHAIHLLFSANRWEAADQITASIEAGTTVVIDRYYYSGIVFSVAKNRPDLTLQWARQPEVGLPRPDLCLFLDIVPDVAASRGGYGNEKYETSSMQKRVRELFMDLLQGEDGEDVRIIDAGRSAEDVEKDVVKLVDETMTGKVLQTQLRTISP